MQPVVKVYLETERLILREFIEADADELLALDSDPEVMRYVGPYGLPDREAYLLRIRVTYRDYYARPAGFGFWVGADKAHGGFIGWFHLRPALDYRFAAAMGYTAEEVDLGYRLRQAAWGKGYATELARALVDKAFTQLQAAHVVATALIGNVASIRVLEKAGLRRVGESILPGFDQLAVKFAISKEQFVARMAPR